MRQLPVVLYSLTIACSSLLLFLVQPILAKALLPAFGGSAGVWVTCMLFFQVVLLLGYGYSYLVTYYLGRKLQRALHGVLLAASLALLPLGPRMAWAAASPVPAILLMLAASVGLPYFLLSTTSPLLQAWYAGTGKARFPYRLFAVSNAASLAALLAYPFAIEPAFSESRQMVGWSTGYLAFVFLAGLTAIRCRGQQAPQETPASTAAPRSWLWITLAACASALWLATANHLSQEVAPIPFLWILPLSVYLLSFVLCFESRGWYRRTLFRILLPLAWIAVGLRIQGSMGGLALEIPVLVAALFVCCMFCHGELADSKPDPEHGLTWFYLMVALGGALGAVFVGIVAPNIFSTYLELPIAITACVLLALALLYGLTSRARLVRIGLVAVLAFAIAIRFQGGGRSVVRVRNFYGALLVSDSGDGNAAVRSLYNGNTLHGVQYLAPARSWLGTAYYGPDSGAALAIVSRRHVGQRVGVIGLGAGTLAVYGRRGESFRFFEINPAVIRIASEDFRFLAESGAQTDVIAGDGRLTLGREPEASFDVIVVDAFADDSIPVHLLTREAFAMYFARLKPRGLLAIHITNRYLELYPVVAALAGDAGRQVLLVRSRAFPERQVAAADWAVIADPTDPLPELTARGERPTVRQVRLWTDDYSNLFRVLR